MALSIESRNEIEKALMFLIDSEEIDHTNIQAIFDVMFDHWDTITNYQLTLDYITSVQSTVDQELIDAEIADLEAKGYTGITPPV